MTTNANLYALFERNFPEDRHDSLLRCADGKVYSYADAERESARIANCLLRIGAQPGERVTVQVEKSPFNLFLYLACLRAGLVYHSLNTAYRANELKYFLDNAEPRIVVCEAAAEELISSLLPARGISLLSLEQDGAGSLTAQAADCSVEIDTAPAAADDMAALLYSSGTTGRPKGIVLTHDNLYFWIHTLANAWGFSSRDCLLHALPIYHVHGLFAALGCVLMSGASMEWLQRFDTDQVMQRLPRSTVMMGVPTFYTRLLANPDFGAELCGTIRLFISGSAPLLAQTFAEFEARTGHAILQRYGMTETGMITSNPLHGRRRAGSAGLPLPGVEVRVVDEHGAATDCGDTGNLQVRGRNVFPGYWRMPGQTAEDFTADGFFNTGDQACVDEDGYLSIVGRSKDMIISGGLNVYPREVELVIDQMDGVGESAVIGVEDADFGEAVVAVVAPLGEAPGAEALLAHCRQNLANYKVPKQVHYLEQLPRNAMGKVQKNLLRDYFAKP